MPFGKYKGKAIEDVPSDYLKWVLDEQREFMERASKELRRRTR